MNAVQQKKAIKKFVDYWTSTKGRENAEKQSFWNDVVDTFGNGADRHEVIEYEVPTNTPDNKKIDAYFRPTGVLVEHKSRGENLDEAYKQAFDYRNRLGSNHPVHWIVVSDFDQFRIYDVRDKLNGEYQTVYTKDLESQAYMLAFLFERNTEKIRVIKETAISVEAGDIIASIYEKVKKGYRKDDPTADHALNVFCVRLVFCLYADSAGLFGHKGHFREYMLSTDKYTSALRDLFKALNTPEDERWDLDAPLEDFPYVNGKLFKDELKFPTISKEVIDLLFPKDKVFDWSGISPTVFGAIFESTLNPETRREGGMHYTSIENIHKVIDPLFLDDLKAELDRILKYANAKTRIKHLLSFKAKLASLKFFDPACGSGNFLTETYISLRRLENRALEQWQADRGRVEGQFIMNIPQFIEVTVDQFYGIEIHDFAATVAKTALWIAEGQMLQETVNIIGKHLDYLPLSTGAHITEGNALRLDWNDEIPAEECDYILGNPPFHGARKKSKQQGADLREVFGNNWDHVGDLDYVAGWFKKSADYMQGTSIHAALVATNSISQGISVGALWDALFKDGVHIDFAWQSFVWDNEAKTKAHVYVVIIGFSMPLGASKKPVIYTEDGALVAKEINGYLRDNVNICVKSRETPLCDAPKIGIGNKPIDDGLYLFTEDEMHQFIKAEPRAQKWFRPWYGSNEFIAQKPRWCLWLGDCSPSELASMPKCKERVRKVQEYRYASKSPGTRKLGDKPTRFHVENMPKGSYIVIPEVSTHQRKYIPIGFMDESVLCSNKLRLVDSSDLYHFGVLTSSSHNAWMRGVGGRMKVDYSYSKDIVYNNFPWPDPSPQQKAAIEKTAQNILDVREQYSDCTLKTLYDRVGMPYDLYTAHKENDKAVMKAYGWRPSEMTEEKILERLLLLYQKLVDEEETD